MRERVFAVLGDRVDGARVLDLFAGTGAVGLEALSRGACSVVFVERHRTAANLIERNLSAFDVGADRAEVIARPARAAIERLARRGDRFHLVWADPPFEAWSEGCELVVRLFETGVLFVDSQVCLECPAKADVAAALPSGLQITRNLAGGASRVVMIETADSRTS